MHALTFPGEYSPLAQVMQVELLYTYEALTVIEKYENVPGPHLVQFELPDVSVDTEPIGH
jgi:hypothetical protein